MTKQLHWLTWALSPKDSNRPLKSFQVRDGAAAFLLSPYLLAQGYALGEIILQPPYMGKERPPSKLREVEYDFVKPKDLLLQTTRPPMDDVSKGNMKQVLAAYTTFEKRVFDVWREYLLEYCARTEVKLETVLGRSLPEQYTGLREVTFRQKNVDGAPYMELNALDGRGKRKPTHPNRTLAFLLRLEEAWKGGPGLLGAFAMDGTATLVWAYKLAHELRGYLQEPGIVLAELENTGIPKDPLTDTTWAAKWKVHEVLHSAL